MTLEEHLAWIARRLDATTTGLQALIESDARIQEMLTALTKWMDHHAKAAEASN